MHRFLGDRCRPVPPWPTGAAVADGAREVIRTCRGTPTARCCGRRTRSPPTAGTSACRGGRTPPHVRLPPPGQRLAPAPVRSPRQALPRRCGLGCRRRAGQRPTGLRDGPSARRRSVGHPAGRWTSGAVPVPGRGGSGRLHHGPGRGCRRVRRRGGRRRGSAGTRWGGFPSADGSPDGLSLRARCSRPLPRAGVQVGAGALGRGDGPAGRRCLVPDRDAPAGRRRCHRARRDHRCCVPPSPSPSCRSPDRSSPSPPSCRPPDRSSPPTSSSSSPGAVPTTAPSPSDAGRQRQKTELTGAESQSRLPGAAGLNGAAVSPVPA